MVRYIILLGVFLSVGFISCKKEEKPSKGPNCVDKGIKYISPEISHFKFKKGSYWVFVDSVAGGIDTLRVDSIVTNGLFPYQYCPDNYHEYYAFSVIQTGVWPNQAPDMYLLDETGLKLNPRDENYPTIYSSNRPKTDSMFIYDRYYKSVVESSQLKTGNNTVFYINTTDGFLKKEVYSNSLLTSKKLLKTRHIVR